MSEPNWLRELAARNADEYRRIPERIRAAAELEYRRRTSEAAKRNLGPTRQAAAPAIPPLGESSRLDDGLPVVAPPDRSADPRLANMPDDLRAVAVEFLDLHGAWGTEFEASIDARDEVTLRWSDYTEKRGVTEYAQADIHKAKGFRLTWGRNGFDGFIGKIEAKGSPLRLSADFAEFVQRFRVGGEE